MLYTCDVRRIKSHVLARERKQNPIFLTVCIVFKIPENKICACRRVGHSDDSKKVGPYFVRKAEEIRTAPLPTLRPLAIGEPGTVR